MPSSRDSFRRNRVAPVDYVNYTSCGLARLDLPAAQMLRRHLIGTLKLWLAWPHLMADRVQQMKTKHVAGMGSVSEFPETRSTERAECELCGGVITTTNGGRHTGLGFISFERLLDLHMKERHANICPLPVPADHRKAA